jgi:hypothetical protein
MRRAIPYILCSESVLTSCINASSGSV